MSLLSCLLLSLVTQYLPPISAATDYARLHEGVNPPKLLHSSDPAYTPQALEAGIEGSVVLQAVVDAKGNVTYASVLSPLPAGLDSKALTAVKSWRYTPAVMDAETIPVLTTIDVSFKLPYKPGHPAEEQRRKDYQGILNRTSNGTLAPRGEEVRKMKELASRDVISAVGLMGEWKVTGLGVPKDVPVGLKDLRRAADRNDARALCFLGKAELAGGLLPKDEGDAWRLMGRAAFLGNADAQFALGDKSERANDWNQAKRYFRMCAATAQPACEYRLGKLLVDGPGVNPNDFSQGIAWLELAKEHGDKDAARLWQASVAKLSSIQLEWVAQLKPHLELKNFKGF